MKMSQISIKDYLSIKDYENGLAAYKHGDSIKDVVEIRLAHIETTEHDDDECERRELSFILGFLEGVLASFRRLGGK